MRSHCQKAAQSAIETDGRRGNIGLVYCATPDELRRLVFLYFLGEINKILRTSYEPQTEKLKVQAVKKKKKERLLIREAMLSLAGTELWGSQGRTSATTNDKSLRLSGINESSWSEKAKKKAKKNLTNNKRFDTHILHVFSSAPAVRPE